MNINHATAAATLAVQLRGTLGPRPTAALLAEIKRLRAIEQRARQAIDFAGSGPLDQAAVLALRFALTGNARLLNV